MKAIYKRSDLYCVVIEAGGVDDLVLLEPVDGDEGDRFYVPYSDPNLIIDPTDAQLPIQLERNVDPTTK